VSPVCALDVTPPLEVIVQWDFMVRRGKNDSSSIEIFGWSVGKFRLRRRFLCDGDVTSCFDEFSELGVGYVGLVHKETVDIHPVDRPGIGSSTHPDHVHVGRICGAHRKFPTGNPHHSSRSQAGRWLRVRHGWTKCRPTVGRRSSSRLHGGGLQVKEIHAKYANQEWEQRKETNSPLRHKIADRSKLGVGPFVAGFRLQFDSLAWRTILNRASPGVHFRAQPGRPQQLPQLMESVSTDNQRQLSEVTEWKDHPVLSRRALFSAWLLCGPYSFHPQPIGSFPSALWSPRRSCR
jgi:hypothetical protein